MRFQIFTSARVFFGISSNVKHIFTLMACYCFILLDISKIYACRCENQEPHTKILAKSLIMIRYQKVWVFWKVESACVLLRNTLLLSLSFCNRKSYNCKKICFISWKCLVEIPENARKTFPKILKYQKLENEHFTSSR